jgi:MTH538 TIR-like domain (DUF1863)
MARRVFYSFHYQRDVQRAQVVRQSWVTQPDRETAGFFDSSVFESKQRTSDDALKSFLNEGLKNSSVNCVLAGNQTAWRRWVRYELLRSFVDGRGIIGISVHSIANFQKQTDSAGTNPLECLGFEIKNGTLYFKEYKNNQWVWASDVTSMPASKVVYKLSGYSNIFFNQLFPTYDWFTNDGYNNLGNWVETAAKMAGR